MMPDVYVLCIFYSYYYRVSERIGTTTQITKRTGHLKMPFFFKLFHDEKHSKHTKQLFKVEKKSEKRHF